MDAVISFLVLSTLLQLVVPVVPSVVTVQAVVEVVSGHSTVLSEEDIRLRCSVTDTRNSTWKIWWFKGSERLSREGDTLVLWRTHVKDSGQFYCQGVRDSVVGHIFTLKSLPVEINVQGGWAILQGPLLPGLVGEAMNLTCHVRGNPRLIEWFLYKDGVEVTRQKGYKSHFHLSNLSLKDQGSYSCRASWDANRRTHSVISAVTQVQVLEVLTQPVLEIDTNNHLIPDKMMKLICHVQYNAYAPAPPLYYHFFKNEERLGTSTSVNHNLFRRTAGVYSCKARVPQLGLSTMSEPKALDK